MAWGLRSILDFFLRYDKEVLATAAAAARRQSATTYSPRLLTSGVNARPAARRPTSDEPGQLRVFASLLGEPYNQGRCCYDRAGSD